jgi:hypothetical protein
VEPIQPSAPAVADQYNKRNLALRSVLASTQRPQARHQELVKNLTKRSGVTGQTTRTAQQFAE